MRNVIVLCAILFGVITQAQTDSNNFRSKQITVEKDSVLIDSLSMNPFIFRVFDSNKIRIDSTQYSIDFATSILVINKEKYPEILVEYYAYPEFLTKTYYKFDKDLIVPYATPNATLYSFSSKNKNPFFKPFDGLNTSGSISRGLTIGSNQDAVVNSALDLQIAGKISDKVTLRASITDSNIPIQENGYTQKLNEFDRVFIELYSDNWNIRAGDVNLQTKDTYFANFAKKVSGVALGGTIQHPDSETTVFASGALVRGKFTTYQFNGQESNQGPYRLFGPNDEQYIIILSGSETVYVNGLPLERGENKDYIIDYNTSELTFTPTFPINANMRISVDFQYSDQNYSRFITHNGANYKSEKFSIGGSYYLESDAKNRSLQQDLTDIQKEILASAGNDTSKMVAPSAVLEPYSENKVLYKKESNGVRDIFVYSNNPDDELYSVRFTDLCNNMGSYQLATTIGTGKIYQYVGDNLGDFAPIIQLVAPNSLQLVVLNSAYNPSEKTIVNAEIALSKNDQNLFSTIDNDTNDGIAGKIEWNQTILDNDWDLKSAVNYESISDNFQTIQRFRNVEFNRDWNILNPTGNQQLINTALTYSNDKNGFIAYSFEFLNFTDSFEGNRHNLIGDLNFDKFKINIISSFLNSETIDTDNSFLRLYSVAKYSFNKSWVGAKINTENNESIALITQNISPLSQKFTEYEGFFGIGDSTKVFVEFGINIRANDSLKNNSLDRVSNAKTYFMNSQLIQNKNTRKELNFNRQYGMNY